MYSVSMRTSDVVYFYWFITNRVMMNFRFECTISRPLVINAYVCLSLVGIGTVFLKTLRHIHTLLTSLATLSDFRLSL